MTNNTKSDTLDRLEAKASGHESGLCDLCESRQYPCHGSGNDYEISFRCCACYGQCEITNVGVCADCVGHEGDALHRERQRLLAVTLEAWNVWEKAQEAYESYQVEHAEYFGYDPMEKYRGV